MLLAGSFVEYPFVSGKNQPNQNTVAGILCPQGITGNHPETWENFSEDKTLSMCTHMCTEHAVSKAHTVKPQHWSSKRTPRHPELITGYYTA